MVIGTCPIGAAPVVVVVLVVFLWVATAADAKVVVVHVDHASGYTVQSQPDTEKKILGNILSVRLLLSYIDDKVKA